MTYGPNSSTDSVLHIFTDQPKVHRRTSQSSSATIPSIRTSRIPKILNGCDTLHSILTPPWPLIHSSFLQSNLRRRSLRRHIHTHLITTQRHELFAPTSHTTGRTSTLIASVSPSTHTIPSSPHFAAFRPNCYYAQPFTPN